MRPLRLAMAAIATAALLAACGSSAGQIPVDSANTLHGDLTAVDTAFLNGDCSAASAALSTAQIDFYNLLATVNQKLAGQLERGLSTLSHDEQRQCRHSGSGGGSTAGTGTGQTGQTGSTRTTGRQASSHSTRSWPHGTRTSLPTSDWNRTVRRPSCCGKLTSPTMSSVPRGSPAPRSTHCSATGVNSSRPWGSARRGSVTVTVTMHGTGSPPASGGSSTSTAPSPGSGPARPSTSCSGSSRGDQVHAVVIGFSP